MISFDAWYADLISNEIWSNPAMMHHKPETFKACANKVYMQYVASEVFPQMTEARKHVYNVVCKTPGDKAKVDWVAKAIQKKEEENKEEWIPITGEERQRRLAEFKAIIDSMPMLNAFDKNISEKEKEEQGKDRPSKTVYPITTPEEYYVRVRHFEWVKNNFEARTGHKLPSWISEDDWNIIYDDKHLIKQDK